MFRKLQTPIHPLRLCREIRDFISRDTILVVDGQEILNYGRQTIPGFQPGHRLNSGPFGTMGVGLPFGIGAKAANKLRPKPAPIRMLAKPASKLEQKQSAI